MLGHRRTPHPGPPPQGGREPEKPSPLVGEGWNVVQRQIASAPDNVIPAGSASGSVILTAVRDTLDEDDETIVVDITTVVNGTESGVQQVVATITDDDAPPSVSFNAASSSGSESTTSVNIPVSLSTASGQTVTVGYAVTGDTATGGGVDYTLANGTLTFAPGVTSQNISITVVNDTADEDDETIEVTLASPSNAALGAITIHSYTIQDNDSPPSVAFGLASSNGAESITPANLAVVLSAASGKTVTVDYAVTGGTATGGGVDYSLASGTLTFAPGVTNQNIAIAIVDDALDEPNETIVVTLSSPTNATLGATTAHTYTITDNDNPPTVTLSLSGSPMVEAAGVATVTATLSAPSAQTVTVNLAFSGTATVTTDYTRSGTSIVIPPGSTNGTITLTAVQDSIDETDETIIVDISSVTNGTESGTQQVTATITDDDGPTISINNVSVTEGNTGSTVNANFSVTISAASPQVITVNYASADGTATAGSDYVAKSGTVTFPANTTGSQTITVVVNGDNIDEANETFTVNLSNPAHATIANGTGTGTINSSGAESVTPANLAVALATASGKTVTVNYAVTGGTATGGGVDFTLASGTLTFAPGVTNQTIAIAIVDDALNEPNETILVTLSSPTNATVGATATHTYTITNDDPPPTVTLSLSGSPMAEAGGVATVTATLSAVSGQTVTVNLAFSGTATLTSDYTRSGSSIVIPAGSTAGAITLVAVQDSLDEVDETIMVDISSVTNGTESGTQQVIATIADDDLPPTVSFNVASSGSLENVTPAALAVSLSTVSGKTVTVDYAVTGGTATGGGVDYTLANGTLTFTPGVTSQNVNIAVVNDTLDEDDETVVVSLSNPANATLGAFSTHTYTILDNDPLPSLSINNVTVTESDTGNVTATFAVTLSAASGRTVTVDYATADGSAVAGSDYNAASGVLTFNAGQTTQTITVVVRGDVLDEANETFTVNLSNPVNATISTATGTGTITDNDPAPTVTLSLSGSPMAEAGGVATVTANLSAVSGQTVTVNLASAVLPTAEVLITTVRRIPL